MMLRTSAVLRSACCLGMLILSSAVLAQQPVTAADYARAEKFLPTSMNRLMTGMVRPVWISGTEDFWYRSTSPTAGGTGSAFILVDAATGKQEPVFDAQKVAASIGELTGKRVDAHHLPLYWLSFSPDLHSVVLDLAFGQYVCDRSTATCTEKSREPAASIGRQSSPRPASEPPRSEPLALSPDGKRAVFIRDWNLWLRDMASGKETQLTSDGVKNFGYATDNAGWASSDRPVVLWSPDSEKIATFQQDQRGDGDMYIVETKVGHPILHDWKYPLPGDPVVTMIQRVIIDVDSGQMVRLRMPPDQHRSTLCDNVACGAGPNGAPLWSDVEWAPDAKTIAFVSTSRDHKIETLRVADAATGAVRDVYQETSPSEFEGGLGRVNWHYLPQKNQFLWYSERSDWGHMYLYDLATGKMKNPITSGAWVVAQVLRVDEARRQIWFTAMGREPGEDPYFTHFYRVDFDGSHLTPLTPASGDHTIVPSDSGKYFVDSVSTLTTPPTTVVRDDSGREILSLGTADITRLIAAGWKPPIPVRVKARDGKTDIYGVMYEPTQLDPSKKYPVVDYIYPGPQVGSVGPRSFAGERRDAQALAELGFIVVELDGMGTTNRSRSFREVSYTDMGDNTLPDQVAGVRELAQKYPFMDIGRVGIYGHSGGGFAAADAMLRYPDFFKVGIAESGNHDNREYEDDWGERYQGLLKTNADGRSNYDNQANQLLAKNLQGHLLLAHGTMDNNVPPYNTLLLVDALIRANKDFDLLLLPNQHHGYGSMSNYMMRRRWDYFVRWLLNTEPPKEFEISAPPPGPPGPMGPYDSDDGPADLLRPE